MSASDHLYWIPLLPLVGAAINGVAATFRWRLPKPLVSAIACAGPLAAFALGVIFFGEAQQLGSGELVRWNLSESWNWIEVGDLKVPFAFTLDPLASVMVLVVTGVGALIHIYSIGYMARDAGYARFFAYMNLFLTMMLILVLADSALLLFLGWEGVGLCSYLLIGFWHDDLANTNAGKKAFLVNRIGDLGFALGLFLAFTTYGSLDFSAMNEGATAGNVNFWIPLLFFVGATGKSAQIPLFVWLPDAMAGPTPVSALIHAATMVTSGVYLLNRSAPLYAASPEVLLAVAVIGGLTAFVAGYIALSQFDIKKVLAYSTVSQLGYMFLACGVGSFTLGMYHVVTHALFKGLLFLGAGAVIHSMHHEQDMRRMGGLRHKIPVTFSLMVVGTLTIAGFPLFAGFFSKDAILVAAMEKGLHGEEYAGVFLGLWILGVITALMTAFYSFRLLAMTFFGAPRFEERTAPEADENDGEGVDEHDVERHGGPVVEAPWVMLAPMAVLAVLCVIGGFLGIAPRVEPTFHAHEFDWVHGLGLALGVLVFAGGVMLVWFLYGKSPETRIALTEKNVAGRVLNGLSRGKLFVDEIYDALIVRPLGVTAQLLFFLVDRLLIEGVLVMGSSLIVRGFGSVLRTFQSGRVPTYAGWVVAGALVLLVAVLAFR